MSFVPSDRRCSAAVRRFVVVYPYDSLRVPMHLALWSSPPADVFAAVPPQRPSPWVVEAHPARTCTDLLLAGQVDVALLPSVVVFSHTDVFDVLPGAALSTWRNPYARLVLHAGLDRVQTVAYDPDHSQEALLARIILHEHYGLEPGFAAYPGASTEDLVAADASGALLVGTGASRYESEGWVLDLGEEWYELVNYPMVWGLFAVRKDEAVPEQVEALLDLAAAVEDSREAWAAARMLSPGLQAFYAESLRLRFDDLATASLTELRQFLYFYNLTDEIPALPLYETPGPASDPPGPLPLI